MATATDRKFDLLSLGTFVVLGFPDGMLGTAWLPGLPPSATGAR